LNFWQDDENSPERRIFNFVLAIIKNKILKVLYVLHIKKCIGIVSFVLHD
jgi:hypothetical protein